MNISPRTGRVTLTKMDRQTVERFASLADAMNHHLSKSDHDSDVRIGNAAFTAGVYATALLMAIDGVSIPDKAPEASNPRDENASSVEQVHESAEDPIVESAPKAKAKKS